MATFIETPRFPEKISLASSGGPMFQTDVVMTDSGDEFRTQRWDQPMRIYTISQPPTSKSDLSSALRAFFLIVRGRAVGFRYKDWTDYTATMAEGILTLISGANYQMWKRYTVGGVTFDRKITKPVNGPAVTVNSGVIASIDYTTGIISMTSGTPSHWAGQFDVPVRFDTDKMDAEVIDKHATGELIIGWTQINLLEIRR